MGKRLLLGLLLVTAGVIVGVTGVAVWSPFRSDLAAEVQSGALLAVGAIVAGLLAVAGAYVGGSVAAQAARAAATLAAETAAAEGRQARQEAREQRIRDEIRRLGTLIVTDASRHVQDIADQLAARDEAVGRSADTPLPVVGNTTAIEDAINRLYTLGGRAQRAGDIAAAQVTALGKLDQLAFVRGRDAVNGKIPALTEEQRFHHELYALTTRLIKPDLMSAVAVAAGGEPLAPRAERDQLPIDYLRDQVARARQRLSAVDEADETRIPFGTISGSVTTD